MKQSKRYIAVTGGIGSGKSTVARLIGTMGYPVFSADAAARDIYSDPCVLAEVRRRFPACIRGGEVDRKALADVVFSDKAALRALDSITHPAIMCRLWDEMRAAQGGLVFAEVPLLLEGGYEDTFDGVIVVRRPREARIRAVIERDGLTREEVLSRMKNQFDYEKNPLNGHTVIENDGDVAALKVAVEQVVYAMEAEK